MSTESCDGIFSNNLSADHKPKCLDHLFGVLESIAWMLCAGLGKPFIEACGHGCEARWHRWIAGANLQDQSAEGIALEGAPARHAFERDDSHGPQVGFVVDVLGALDLLGAHVVGRPDHCSGACVAAGRHLAGNVLRHTEVEDLGEDLAVIRDGEEDVVGLDVAVDDAFCVGFVECDGGVPKDSKRLLR